MTPFQAGFVESIEARNVSISTDIKYFKLRKVIGIAAKHLLSNTAPLLNPLVQGVGTSQNFPFEEACN